MRKLRKPMLYLEAQKVLHRLHMSKTLPFHRRFLYRCPLLSPPRKRIGATEYWGRLVQGQPHFRLFEPSVDKGGDFQD